MTASFAADTEVVAGRDLHYDSTLVDGWDIYGNPNGGYVAALMMRAVVDASVAASGHGDPVTSTHHFLRPAKPGPIEIDLVASRMGRTLATFSGVLRQDGKEIIRSLVTLGTAANMDGPELITASSPELPPLADCVWPGDDAPNFVRRIDVVHTPTSAGYSSGQPSGEPRMEGWLALGGEMVDGSNPADAVAMTIFADAMPPTIFNTGLAVGWAPTVELTVHYRRVPASARLAVTYTSKFISGGMMSGDVELWDTAGNLVAEARQLALVPKTS